MDSSKTDVAPRRKTAIYSLLIVLAGILAYANSFQGEFILDDFASIQNNLTIRHLWPLAGVFPGPEFIPDASTVEGRPVLNLSFALNYAAGGLERRGYHAANLGIHLLAALLLFTIVRRTLLLPVFRGQWNDSAATLGFWVAVIWAVHPLQTESVTYLSQRAESLVGLFYLLTLSWRSGDLNLRVHTGGGRARWRRVCWEWPPRK